MKWKPIIVAVLIMVFLVIFTLLAIKAFQSQETIDSQVERDTKARIEKLKITKEYEQLVTEILTLRYNAEVIRSKLKPAPIPKPVKLKE